VVDKNQKLIDVLIQQGKIKTGIDPNWRNLSNLEMEEKLQSEHIVSSEDIARGYAGLYSLPYVHLADFQISQDLLNFIPEDLARNYKIIAYQAEKETESNGLKVVRIAIAEPVKLTSNLQEVIANLEKQKGFKIELAVTTMGDFLAAISKRQTIPSGNQMKEPTMPVANFQKTDFKTIELDKIIIPYEVITKFPENIAQKYNMVVFEAPNSSFIRVAVADPEDKKVREILDFVKTKNDITIEEYKVTPSEVQRAMRFYNPEASKPVPKPTPPPPQPTPTPEIRSVEKIVPPPVSPQPQAPVQNQPQVKPQEEIKQEEIKPIPPQVQKPLEKPISPVQKQPEETPEVQGPSKNQLIVPVENDLDKYLGTSVKEVSDLQKIAETGNVPKIVAATVALAVAKKASDIHIEATEKNVRIRFRVDGILRDIIKLSTELQPAIISRVKILSKLKIDETRIPQDGRFDCIATGHAIDLRISTLPTVHGEKIAMRLLDKSAHLYTLEELGVTGRGLKLLLENMNKPYGIILSTGPTGSGKSTTLYAILTRISNASVNIVTLEDPVEYEMAGVNQCQIRPKIGFTFANGLRSILRQDPNIIMVGEIRDGETAALSTHAALTGHLVLSTLHTNDAAGALPRLTDMGVEPFFITSLINAIIGQRLVRKLCPKCKRQAHIPEPIFKQIEKELEGFNLPKPYQFFEGAGCSECELGYKGRLGIFEVLTMSQRIEELVLEKKPSSVIRDQAIKEGMVTMKQDGLIKALKGLTTVNEVMRVITV